MVKNMIRDTTKDILSDDFTTKEIKEAIDSMKSLASLGSDGLPAFFYQCYWDVVGNDLITNPLNILNKFCNVSKLNKTFICLIPKVSKPTTPSDSRPISLCNVTLKIVTKVISNRIKPILN